MTRYAWHNKNGGRSVMDPAYDHDYDEDADYDAYEEALIERAEESRHERD